MSAEKTTSKKKILVGFDGSEVSRAAAERAASVARGLGYSLWLVYVIPPLNGAVLGDFSGFASTELIDLQRRTAEQMMGELRKTLESPSLPVEISVFVDGPAAKLAHLADEPSIEMVAIGASGAGAVARLLLGSVALRLLHVCKKPMLLVPRE